MSRTDNETVVPLVALHNLSPESLRKILALGGLPMPSIAVLPAGMPYEDFGSITLIAPPSLVDPSEGGSAHLFSADVFSPRVPPREWRVNLRSAHAMRRRLEQVAPLLDDYVSDFEVTAERGREAIVDALVGSRSAKFLWLQEIGAPAPDLPRLPVPLERDLSGALAVRAFHAANPEADLRSRDFVAVLKAATEELVAAYTRAGLSETDAALPRRSLARTLDTEGLVNYRWVSAFERDRQTILQSKTALERGTAEANLDASLDGAGRDRFEAWVREQADLICSDPRVKVGPRKLPYTLENAVAAMRREAIRGVEGGIVFSLGRARSIATRRFESLAEAGAAARDLIVDRDTYEARKKGVDEAFFALGSAILPRYTIQYHNPVTRSMEALDDLSRSIHDWLKGKGRSEADMRRSLRKNHYEPTAEDSKAAIEVASALERSPTTYFEAKVLRAVRPHEFVAAVIPETAPAWVEEGLRETGLTEIVRYSMDERAEAVLRVARSVGVVPPEVEQASPSI